MNDIIIFVDLDGVLCNFIDAVEEIYPGAKELQKTYFGVNRHQEHPDLTKQYQDFRNAIINKKHFWRDLPWTEDGKQLVSHIITHIPLQRLAIITAPMKNDEERCNIEKRQWVSNNIPFISSEDVFVEKHKYKIIDPSFNGMQILIDDHQDNIDEWISHGGIGILHKNTKETIEQLQKLL